MVQKLRERSNGEGGFTLVELLVVMLILGLLAAIAIPSFFNQRDKAKDADAKADVRTAQTAMETYATDNDGSYAGATVADPRGHRGDADRCRSQAVSGLDRSATYAVAVVSAPVTVLDRPCRNGATTYTCDAGRGRLPDRR